VREAFDAEGLAGGCKDASNNRKNASSLCRVIEVRFHLMSVDPDVFKSWFPACVGRVANPSLRVICFANAGGSENSFTGPIIKSGKRNANRLMQWASENQVEVLAPQLPGRESRRREPTLDSCVGAARALLPIITPEVSDGVPYVIVGHSVGCWVAYELVRLLRQNSLPPPVHAFLSSFPPPDIPLSERPWTANGGGTLSDKDFQEECRGWDVNEVVFSEQMWAVYGGLLRADFGLFDTYMCPSGDKSMASGVTVFYTSNDKRITEAHVRGWARFGGGGGGGGGAFTVERIEGNHMFVSNQDQKAAWFDAIASQLDHILASSRPAPHLIPVSPEDFKRWFPACNTAVSGTSNALSAAEASSGIRRMPNPRMRMICIPRYSTPFRSTPFHSTPFHSIPFHMISAHPLIAHPFTRYAFCPPPAPGAPKTYLLRL
jgi:surfactin synthase thioesterase subunit